jgi:ribose transport system permease protein
MSLRSTLSRLRYRYFPDHILGEILSKTWIDNAIPVAILVLVLAGLGLWDGDLVSLRSLTGMAPQYAETLLVTLGMVFVLLAGGIDLSVGSVFALSNFIVLALFNMLGLPIGVAIAAAILAGGLVGAVNGVLIGYLKLRAFLTTLVTMIIVKSVVDLLLLSFAVRIATPVTTSSLLGFPGFDTVLRHRSSPRSVRHRLPVAGHIILTRLRAGWHVMAVGGNRAGRPTTPVCRSSAPSR